MMAAQQKKLIEDFETVLTQNTTNQDFELSLFF